MFLLGVCSVRSILGDEDLSANLHSKYWVSGPRKLQKRSGKVYGQGKAAMKWCIVKPATEGDGKVLFQGDI